MSMSSAEWQTGRPDKSGYYLAAWQLNGRWRVSELWFNPDAIGTGWFPSRGYLPGVEDDIVAAPPAFTISVEAWQPMPRYPS